jgi:hypothetical protein
MSSTMFLSPSLVSESLDVPTMVASHILARSEFVVGMLRTGILDLYPSSAEFFQAHNRGEERYFLLASQRPFGTNSLPPFCAPVWWLLHQVETQEIEEPVQ